MSHIVRHIKPPAASLLDMPLKQVASRFNPDNISGIHWSKIRAQEDDRRNAIEADAMARASEQLGPLS